MFVVLFESGRHQGPSGAGVSGCRSQPRLELPAGPGPAALVLEQLQGRDLVLGCLLVDAGLRVSEACGLTWADVSLSEQLVHVRGQLAPLRRGEPGRIVKPKSSRGVLPIPMLPRLQAALEALYAGEGDAGSTTAAT